MKIRKAKLYDIDTIYELGRNIEEFHISPNTDRFWPKTILNNLIQSKDDILLVAEHENKIIGFTIVTINKATLKATIENIFVLAEYRHQGVALKLYNSVEKILHKKKIKYVCTFVENTNIASSKISEKLNFEKGKLYYWHMKTLY